MTVIEIKKKDFPRWFCVHVYLPLVLRCKCCVMYFEAWRFGTSLREQIQVLAQLLSCYDVG